MKRVLSTLPIGLAIVLAPTLFLAPMPRAFATQECDMFGVSPTERLPALNARYPGKFHRHIGKSRASQHEFRFAWQGIPLFGRLDPK
jgi:hypothetical protein